MPRYFSEQDLIETYYQQDIHIAYDLEDLEEYLRFVPTADVAPKSEVLNEIEALNKKVGQIYNHYVFEDTDYADDDVAIEAVINALTEVLNELAELKKKYTEGEE